MFDWWQHVSLIVIISSSSDVYLLIAVSFSKSCQSLSFNHYHLFGYMYPIHDTFIIVINCLYPLHDNLLPSSSNHDQFCGNMFPIHNDLIIVIKLSSIVCILSMIICYHHHQMMISCNQRWCQADWSGEARACIEEQLVVQHSWCAIYTCANRATLLYITCATCPTILCKG